MQAWTLELWQSPSTGMLLASIPSCRPTCLGLHQVPQESRAAPVPYRVPPCAQPAGAPWWRHHPDPRPCVADEARSKKCGVLVHCLAGISRSVTVTVAYLMQKMNLSLNDAYDFVKRKKSNISPNFNFMGQLLDFERTLGLSSPCDNHAPSEQLYFSTPANHNLFPLNTLEST